MSEPGLKAPDERSPNQQTAGPMTSGALLRQAREAQGLHIAALAVLLKVPVKKIEALESDRFDLLPDTVFVRALAASVCRTLKIDLEPILEKLPHTAAPQLKSYGAGVNVPFRSSGGHATGLFRDQLSKPLLWVVALLLVGALALLFVPFARQATAPVAVKPDVVDLTSTPALSVTAVPAAVEVPASQTVQPMTDTPASQELVAGSGALTGAVVFKAQAQSWVEVIDASGMVQVRRNMAAGETVGATGVLPLAVVVGRADTTAVEVHGVPFDVQAVARNNVARFEVK
jgi:cytoskeleton protein RodZ